jgi:hypothetical protein
MCIKPPSEDSGSVVVDEPKTNVDENLLEDEASEIKGGFKGGKIHIT